MKTFNRTKDKPWSLKTAPGTAEFTMHTDSKDGLALLVCTVGKTVLHYGTGGVRNSKRSQITPGGHGRLGQHVIQSRGRECDT